MQMTTRYSPGKRTVEKGVATASMNLTRAANGLEDGMCPYCGMTVSDVVPVGGQRRCSRCQGDLGSVVFNPQSTAPELPPELPGEFEKAYELGMLLGAGCLTRVHLATRRRDRASVAVKFLVRQSPQSNRRFLQEIKLLQMIQHPGVVTQLDSGEGQNLMYLITEYMPGGTLRDRLQGTPWPVRDAIRVTRACLDAIQACHERGVVHRDLKPENILFTAEGSPKIADFGIAKAYGSEQRLTVDRAVLGTPLYMSPEQQAGQVCGASSDIYSMALILLEMLTGEPGCRPGEKTLGPPRLAKLRPDLPPELVQLVDRALSIHISERPRAAGEFSQRLARAVSTTGTKPVPAAKQRALPILACAGIMMAVAGLFGQQANAPVPPVVRPIPTPAIPKTAAPAPHVASPRSTKVYQAKGIAMSQGELMDNLLAPSPAQSKASDFVKRYIDKLSRMTPDEREKLKASIQKFMDPKVELTKSQTADLAGHKTSPTKPDDFNNRLQAVRVWSQHLSETKRLTGDMASSLEWIFHDYRVNPIAASQRLDQLIALCSAAQEEAPRVCHFAVPKEPGDPGALEPSAPANRRTLDDGRTHLKEGLIALELGWVHYERSLAQAIDELTRVVATNETAESTRLLGSAYLHRDADWHDRECAVWFLKRSRALKDDPETSLMLGHALSLYNRTEECIASYQMVLKAQPKNAACLYAIALAYDRSDADNHVGQVLAHAFKAVAESSRYKRNFQEALRNLRSTRALAALVSEIIERSENDQLTDKEADRLAQRFQKMIGDEGILAVEAAIDGVTEAFVHLFDGLGEWMSTHPLETAGGVAVVMVGAFAYWAFTTVLQPNPARPAPSPAPGTGVASEREAHADLDHAIGR